MADSSEPPKEGALLPENMRAKLGERLQLGKLELPMLPEVAQQVMSESIEEESNIRKLAALIYRDQALAGHVLKVANSAAYSPGTPIVSLQQAMVRMGLNQLREIVIAVAFQTRIFQARGFEVVVKALWKHSAAAGAFAKEIARLKRGNVESAFLCGLLHDVGKPIVLLALADLQSEAKTRFELPAVMAAVEEHYAPVGAHLATQWSLPSQVIDSIRYHKDYSGAPVSQEAVMITCLADRLSHFAVTADSFNEKNVREHPVYAALNLYPDDIDILLDKRPLVMQFVEAFT